MTEADDSGTMDATQGQGPSENAPQDQPLGGGQPGPPAEDSGGVFASESKPLTYLSWGAFAVLLLLALVATVRFYLSASNAIGIWIAPDYVPIFQSAFNLAVLFACAIGLSILVRRMRD